MANMGNGGITPGLFTSYDRQLNQQDPYQYDPNNYVDPLAAVQAQQQWAKQIFALQNPRLALPQQFGSAIGQFLQGKLPGGSQAPVPGQAPGGPGGPSGPSNPVAQAVEALKIKYMQQGIPQGEALFKAAGDLEASGQYTSDPTAEKVLNHASTYAKEKLGYTPMTEKERRDMQMNAENLALPNGSRQAFIKGSPEWNAAIKQGATKAGDTPELTPGSFHEFKKDGRFVTMQVQQDGTLKQVSSSSSPMQYQTSGTPEQMAQGGLIRDMSTAAGGDKAKKEMTDREIATVNAVRGLDKIVDTVKNSGGAAVGTPGDLFEKGQNVVASAQTFASYLGQGSLVDPKTYNWKGLDASIGTMKGNANAATKYHAQMISAAYLMAAAQSPNNTDEKMTRQRVEANLEILAKHSDDPNIIVNTVQQASQMLKDNLKTQAKGYGSTTPLLDDYEESRQPKKPKGKVGPYTDAEKEARYQAWKKSHNGG